jgi:hypothetical protein
LLAGRFRTAFLIRLAVLIAAGIVLPLAAHWTFAMALAFVTALCGEWLGRWLFFVTVVPKNMAAVFSSRSREAA